MFDSYIRYIFSVFQYSPEKSVAAEYFKIKNVATMVATYENY